MKVYMEELFPSGRWGGRKILIQQIARALQRGCDLRTGDVRVGMHWPGGGRSPTKYEMTYQRPSDFRTRYLTTGNRGPKAASVIATRFVRRVGMTAAAEALNTAYCGG